MIASASPGRFCAGLDLAALLKGSHGEAHDIVDKLYARLVDVQFGLGKPSIAAISGEVRGGGITIAISCDMIVADAASTFGNTSSRGGTFGAAGLRACAEIAIERILPELICATPLPMSTIATFTSPRVTTSA